MDLQKTLSDMGFALPAAPKPVAAYVPAVRSGDLLWVSGQLPLADGRLVSTGRVPSATSMEMAQAAARQCVLNGLAVVGDQLDGDWDRLVRIVRLVVFVASDAAFAEQHLVANGASELLGEALGDRGRHVRAAVGVTALPLNATVELELTAQVQ